MFANVNKGFVIDTQIIRTHQKISSVCLSETKNKKSATDDLSITVDDVSRDGEVRRQNNSIVIHFPSLKCTPHSIMND